MVFGSLGQRPQSLLAMKTKGIQLATEQAIIKVKPSQLKNGKRMAQCVLDIMLLTSCQKRYCDRVGSCFSKLHAAKDFTTCGKEGGAGSESTLRPGCAYCPNMP